MKKNWKTTVAGIAAILTVVGTGMTQFTNGGFQAVTWEAVVVGLMSGIGLIFAKDFNVSGTGKPADPPVAPPAP